MTRDQIDLQQSDKQGSLSRGDEASEAAHDGLMGDLQLLLPALTA